ncbi:glycoside hydrolase family 65 protein [Microbacterium telephonicum]|uniref:Alpha,alpha-trehalose phosphorylase n=1 Tax=Microbacterium telephonicum TaxID=1714841 RepID=A0A498CAN8_9MICO|nr:glycosyl hydrolase family 65 protein [Microbacterium telephonicum]RLK52563.1 alpha,alpha-trehalose phosphorylase [Microbacterium telephonicum]
MRDSGFDVADWGIGATGWDPSLLARRESVFAVSNGHLGWRGTLDEGDPCAVAGAYLNGLHERHPMPYAEDGYGYPAHGESVINAPDGKVIRLIVGDEPFDIREGSLEHHRQHLDFRAGTLERVTRWTSPAGHCVEVRSTRLASLARRAIAAVDYRVIALTGPVEVTVLSEVVADEPLPRVHPDDRVMAPLVSPLTPVGAAATAAGAALLYRTRVSGIGVAVAMEHTVTGAAEVASEADDHVARTTIVSRLDAGESVRIVKVVGHEWSDALSEAALRDRVDAAVAAAVRTGWEGLAAEQRSFLDDFWVAADVTIEGDPHLQQAVRFALFQVVQAAARAQTRSIPGKALTGAGYEGHTFWDADAFVVPVLTYLLPTAARDALRWRHATLPLARERAATLHLAGAAFPWRTISGSECSGYWPAGTIAFHINADIASAILHYVRVSGDLPFEREVAVEILVETARLWSSLGRWDGGGTFHIDGVTGPDEYSALVDDNAFTNLAAQRNLRGAADLCRRHDGPARALQVTDDEIAGWLLAAERMAVPFDPVRRVHQQYAGSTDRERWDFDGTSPQQYPLQDHFPYFDLYRKQVVKQADLVLALQFAHESFTAEQTARAFAYAEELTVRDSSLSASPQSVVAARTGHLPLALAYLREAAAIDLADVRGDVADGLHIAALAGVWTAVVSGFGGMREGADGFDFAPRLTPPLTALSYGLQVGGGHLRVEIATDAATYTLTGEAPMEVRHHGERVRLAPNRSRRLAIPPAPDPGPPPRQPRGRAPE